MFKWVDSTGEVHDVGSDDVNEYVRAISGRDFTAKDFRTWAGTFQAAVELAALGPSTGHTATRRRLDAKRKMAEAVRRKAERLHNRPATCRKCINPAIFDAFQQGSLVREMRSAAGRPRRPDSFALSPEAAAVLNVLERSGATRPAAHVG